MNKLEPKALGLSLGVVFGVAFFILAILAMTIGWGSYAIEVVSSWYVGYEATLIGACIGLVWGFCDGLIGGYIIAKLYNKFSK